VTIFVAIAIAYLIGYAAGKASVARVAARELRELQAEFDALSHEARDLQVRAESLAAMQPVVEIPRGYFGQN
jgi:hypothetical protein